MIAAAEAAGLTVDDFRRGPTAGPPDMVIGGQLFVYFDGSDFVQEVEVGVTATDDEGQVRVTCLDLDLAAGYDTVLERMKAHGRVDETHPEYPGTSVYSGLGLSLWADAKAEDLSEVQVEAILVRRPEP